MYRLGVDAGDVDTSPTLITSAAFTALMLEMAAGTKSPEWGDWFRISDGVLANRVFGWNGESFGGFAAQAIAQSYAPITRTSANAAGDATAAVLATITMPPYVMRKSSKLRLTMDWAYVNSVATKTISVLFGGTPIASPSFTTTVATKILTEIVNADSYSAQKVYNSTSYGSTANAHVSGGVDTKAAVAIDLRCAWGAATASETITLLGYTLELIP